MEKCLYGQCDGTHPPCSNCGFFFDWQRHHGEDKDVAARVAIEGTDVDNALAEHFEEIRYNDHP